MDTAKLRAAASENFARLQKKFGAPFLIVIGGVFVLLAIIGIQKYFDRIAETRDDARFAAFEKETADRMKIFQNYIQMANRDHETTTAILDAMGNITKNINQLAENDRLLDARVSQISEGEYKQARGQKNNQAAVRNRTAKSSKPLQTREIEALKTDAELYPDN